MATAGLAGSARPQVARLPCYKSVAVETRCLAAAEINPFLRTSSRSTRLRIYCSGGLLVTEYIRSHVGECYCLNSSPRGLP
jgi:hypothetical protein